MAAIAMVAVFVAAWPGFRAKVGGTIAIVPGFLVLLAGAAGVRLTAPRWALVVVSGLALVIVFALINYLVPGTGHSDIGHFAGQVLHGGAGPTLRRKMAANLGSLTENPFVLVIPAVVILAGAVIARPAPLRAERLAVAYQAIPLLRPALIAIWLIGVLGWLFEDSGVTVPAAALPSRAATGGGDPLRRAPRWHPGGHRCAGTCRRGRLTAIARSTVIVEHLLNDWCGGSSEVPRVPGARRADTASAVAA
jgi:hypothetical protein